MSKPTYPSLQKFPSRKASRRGAFTLLEMLVATTVLALTLVLFGQITSSTVNTTQLAHRQIDVAEQARMAFDRISANLNQAMRTDGVTIFVDKEAAGNDSLAFLANSRPPTGGTSTRSLRGAAIGIKICDGMPDPSLGNGITTASMLSWTNTPFYFEDDAHAALMQAATDVVGTGVGKCQALAPNVFRMEVSLLLSNGTISNGTTKPAGMPAGTPAIPQDTSFTPNKNSSGGFYLALSQRTSSDPVTAPTSRRYVRAIIVGLAGLSSEVRQLKDFGSSLAPMLPDPVDGKTPVDAWDLGTINKAAGSTPRPVLNNIRVFQRYFYVN